MVLAAIVALGLTQATNSAAFPTTDQVVISNAGAILAGSVSTFPAGTSANGGPSFHITGGATGLGANTGVAISPFNLHTYVTRGVVAPSAVRGFAPGTTGNSAPEILISGPATGLSAPSGVAFDTDGDVWITNTLGPAIFAGTCGFQLGNIKAYDPGANGNYPPFGTITDCAIGPVGIVVDDTPENACDEFFGTGPTVFAANNFGGFVSVYCPGALGFAGSLVGLMATFPGPDYLALGSSGDELYVTDPSDNAIDVYDVSSIIGCGFCFPFEGSIIGKRTKLKNPQGIAASLDDDVYVANTLANSFAQFFGDFLGNVRPFSLIRGPHTKMNQPVGVALMPEED
jgi:hypothetical protein